MSKKINSDSTNKAIPDEEISVEMTLDSDGFPIYVKVTTEYYDDNAYQWMVNQVNLHKEVKVDSKRK